MSTTNGTLKAVKNIVANGFLGTANGPGVVGVGIGTKEIGGIDTGVDCVRVYVANKAASSNLLASSEIVPPEIASVKTDIVAIDRIFSARPNVSTRGLHASAADGSKPRPGSSIGPLVEDLPNVNQMLSGTLGAVLRDQNGKLYALSANHVLSVNGRIKGGTPICAPSPEDDLHPPQSGHGTIIATAEPIVIPLNRNDGGSANLVDCAIVELLSPDKVDPVFMEDLHVTDHTAPVRGMKVVKYGKKTGSTCGTITDIHADILVDYSFGSFRFVDQILIESDDDDKPFAADGDSGAVIVDIDSGKAVGLLFAPVGKLTAACPMPAVIEQLSQKLGCSLGFAPSPEPATST